MQFSGGRALKTLVKQHAEMSLLVKHAAHVISVKAFRWRTRSDHVTRKALAARNNEAYGQGNGRQSFRTVLRYHYKHWTREFGYWPFSHKRSEMDYPFETSLCTVAPSPTDTSSPIFSEGRGRMYTGYLKRIFHL